MCPMSMIERVEAIISEKLMATWSSASPLAEAYIRKLSGVLAREVIEAMREPTEAMLASAVKEPVHLYAGRANGYVNSMKAATAADRMAARQRWQDLIDAALSNTRESDNG